MYRLLLTVPAVDAMVTALAAAETEREALNVVCPWLKTAAAAPAAEDDDVHAEANEEEDELHLL